MANLGNVSDTFAVSSPYRSFGLFGLNSRGLAITMSGTSLVPGSFATLSRNGVTVDRTRADASTGVWNFYDMDPSGDQIYTIITQTQAGGPTNETWKATVVGTTVTVTQLGSNSRAIAYASGG